MLECKLHRIPVAIGTPSVNIWIRSFVDRFLLIVTFLSCSVWFIVYRHSFGHIKSSFLPHRLAMVRVLKIRMDSTV